MKEAEKNFEGFNYSGFKLISLEMRNDKLFDSIKYDFINKKNNRNRIYTTVLIGQNGSLKSRLFERIISLFWRLNGLKEGEGSLYFEQFRLIYSLNNSIYEFSNMPQEGEDDSKFEIKAPVIKIDGHVEPDFSKVEMPISIIALAIMLTDRFPFPDPTNFERYKYLGSRYRPQLASTKTFIGRVVEFVSNNIDSDAFINGVRKITNEFLPKYHEPWISYYTSNTPRFFKGKMSDDSFYSYYEDIERKYEDNPKAAPFKLNHYKSAIKNNALLAKQIVEYCNQLKESKELRDFERKSQKAISFNLLSERDINKLRENFRLLDHMRKLGIIYPPEMEFLKSSAVNGVTEIDGYSIAESSSGEHNLFGSLVGIIASIKTNSLLFIDEPEISLHPNWQMKYLSFLNELLIDENYSTCHIFVATHSHFLVSDLEGSHSTVISMSRDGDTNALIATPLIEDTFGWSAENILLNVFNVPTTRNYYVADEIGEILELVSKKDRDVELIREKVSNLVSRNILNLSPQDPLSPIIKRLIEKYG